MIRYNARWIIPVTSAPIANGTIAVADGKIAYVGPRTGSPDCEQVDLGDALILPGLVNAHTHLELTVMRGFLEDLCFTDWIGKLRRGRNEVLTPDDLLDSARLGISEGVRAGVTCFADTCSTGVVLQAMLEAGVRGIMYQEVFAPAPELAEEAMAELEDRMAAMAQRTTDIVSVGVSPHAPYTVSEELYAAVSTYSREHNFPLAMHIAESSEEDELVREGRGPFADLWARRDIPVPQPGANRSPVALLERHDLLRHNSLLIHVTRADETDLAVIAAHDCAVVHCPISNAKLGHGIAPLTRLLEHGIRVGLGSDSMASNNRMDMLEEARMALLFQRAREKRHDALDAQAVLELVTIGGARALGMDDRIGSLEQGKDADIAAFRISHDKALPGANPVSTAIFTLGGSDALMTMVRGTVLVADSIPLRRDEAVIQRCVQAGEALAAWATANGM